MGFVGWFSWTKVHQLEEKALLSFFNGKSENRTPEIYMELRNSIMKKFHANPNTQIEEKDLPEIPIGELDAKKEVMGFLDYWGLINYHPFPEADVASSVGDPEETAKANSLIHKLYEFEVEQLCSPAAPRSSFATPAVPSRLAESILTDESLQPEGPSVEYHCNSCAADCSRKRYHCQKQVCRFLESFTFQIIDNSITNYFICSLNLVFVSNTILPIVYCYPFLLYFNYQIG